MWWLHVPRKAGKGQARRAFKGARKKADAETLLAGIRRYASEVAGEDSSFTKHPSTWLNGECWLDEPPKPKGGAPPATFKSRIPDEVVAARDRAANSKDTEV